MEKKILSLSIGYAHLLRHFNEAVGEAEFAYLQAEGDIAEKNANESLQEEWNHGFEEIGLADPPEERINVQSKTKGKSRQTISKKKSITSSKPNSIMNKNRSKERRNRTTQGGKKHNNDLKQTLNQRPKRSCQRKVEIEQAIADALIHNEEDDTDTPVSESE